MKNTLKHAFCLGSIGFTLFLTPIASQALTVEEVPNPRTTYGGWVTDMANILSDRTEVKLNRLIASLEASNGTEIAVVTVPKTAPASSPKAFTTELFNYWGVGKAEVDNGILFLISVGDRRVEIETGYGIEGILPDAYVSKIIHTKITPQFKQGNFDRGTLDGTKALVSALDTSMTKLISDRQVSLSTSDTSVTNSISDRRVWMFIFQGGGIIAFLTGVTLLWQRRQKVFVKPSKRKLSLKRNDNRSIYCAECQQPMERVANIELSKPQLVAQQIGSVSYRGYTCANCSQDRAKNNKYLIIAYESQSSRYRHCFHCQELTVTRTKETVENATRNHSGKRLITDKCHCCDYLQEKEERIPRLPSPSHDSYSSINYSSTNYSSSVYHNSGGDSFGGGSSDGGGAGGDW